MATQVFVLVREATGGAGYYTVPEDSQTEYSNLREKIEQTWKRNLPCFICWGFTAVVSLGAAITGLVYANKEDDDLKPILIPLLVGAAGIVTSVRCWFSRKRKQNEPKLELNTLRAELAQRAAAVYLNKQVWVGVERAQIIPNGSKIIPITIERRQPDSPRRSPSPQTTEYSVLLDPDDETF